MRTRDDGQASAATDLARSPVSPGGRLFLVSCVKSKRSTPVPARDLYTSPWFRKARAFVERADGRWRILSARHGLLHPHRSIGPYDQTLRRMRVGARREWADRVLGDLDPLLDAVDEVVFLAGLRYREFLEAPLRARGVHVSVPMAGLPIGRQLAWLNRQGGAESPWP